MHKKNKTIQTKPGKVAFATSFLYEDDGRLIYLRGFLYLFFFLFRYISNILDFFPHVLL